MTIKNKLITGANFRDLDWNKAKLFYHIAKCGSLLKAGEIAGTDQSTLTRHVQALERQIGCPLLIRQPSGIALTRKGEELLQEIAPFFLKMKGFCGNNYTEIKGEKKRKIRIATTHALAAYVLSDYILDYTNRNPHVTFDLIADDYLMDIILNDVDIAIQPLGTKIIGDQIKGVEYEYLFSVEKRLYASNGYINTYGEPKTVDDLIDHSIIAFNQSSINFYSNINWILTLGMPEGKYHKPVYTSNSIESLVKAAKKDIGIIGSYQEFSIIKDSNLINVLPDIKDNPYKVYFIYPTYLKGDDTIAGIHDYLAQNLSPHF